MGKKRVRRELATFEINEKLLKPGLCIMLRPPDPKTPPYIAQIEKIEADSHNRVTMRCRWFYRPEESNCGRRKFHGIKELFLSDHYDYCYPEAVEDVCRVLSLKKYACLSAVEEEDFFCRFEYSATTGEFAPKEVAVYCTCEMPYNPDELTIQCDKCKDWYHPGCVKVAARNARDVEAMGEYICPLCI